MSATKTVAIVGGGLGGLATAVALRKFGFEVQVYERARQLAEVGAGITISPQASKALSAIGLGDRMSEVGNRLTTQSFRSSETGQLVSEMDLRPAIEQSPYYLFHRADLLELLAEPVGSGNIHVSHACVEIRENPDSVTVKFENGRSIEVDVVIGADGIRSEVRRYLYGADAPRFTGQTAWRALIDGDAVSPEVLEPHGFYGWVGKGGHIMTYYVRGTRLINIVSQVDSDDWIDKTPSGAEMAKDMRARFAGACPDLAVMLDAVTHCSPWAFFVREPSADWGRGRIQLIGDAAHSMLPNAGQGASQAFEDAYILARWMDVSRDDYTSAFENFRRVRQPRVHAVQRQSAANAKKFHTGKWKPIERGAPQPVSQTLSALGLDWIYSYDIIGEWDKVPQYPLSDATPVS